MEALLGIPELPGVTVSNVHAYAGSRQDVPEVPPDRREADFTKLEIVVSVELVDRVVAAISLADVGDSWPRRVALTGVQPSLVKEIGIHRGQQGIGHIRVDPSSLRVRVEVATLAALGITRRSLAHLDRRPATEALAWRVALVRSLQAT